MSFLARSNTSINTLAVGFASVLLMFPQSSSPVPSTSAVGGESNQYINVREARFKAIGDGKTDDTAAIQAALAAANSARTCILFPPGTYLIRPGTVFPVRGASCAFAYGAMLQDARFAVSSSGFSWHGGTTTQVRDMTNNPMFMVTGNDLTFSDMTVTYANRFTAFHVTMGAQRIKFHNITTNQGGQSGFTINGATDVQGDNITMNGSGRLVDDGIAIIAGNPNQPTTNIAFSNVTGSHIYDILKIGTAVVSPIRNVAFRNLNAYEVKFPIFLEAFTDNKPGVQVENVVVDGINMYDASGAQQDGVLHFLPTNGSIWRNIQIRNVNLTGRFASDGLSQIARIISDGSATVVDGLVLANWNVYDSCNGAVTCSDGGNPPQMLFYYQSNSGRAGNAAVSNISVTDSNLNGASLGAIRTTSPITNFDIVRNHWQNAYTSSPNGTVINVTGNVNYLDNQVSLTGEQSEIAASGDITRR